MSIHELDTYIDRCLLDDYAVFDEDGFHLDVDNLPSNEKLNFLLRLLEEDTSLRDRALSLMQKLIDERLPTYEAEHAMWRKYNHDEYKRYA